MKEKFTQIGILIYVILSIIDRFIIKIEDYIYIPITVLAIVFIILGFVKQKTINNKFGDVI